MPRTAGSLSARASTAASALDIFSGVSVISVGKSAVVPKRRCAAAMARIPSGVGLSLKRASPPPFTCTSINPGVSQAPFGRTRLGTPAGTSPCGTTAKICGPSTITAAWCTTVAPSNTCSATIACFSACLIESVSPFEGGVADLRWYPAVLRREPRVHRNSVSGKRHRRPDAQVLALGAGRLLVHHARLREPELLCLSGRPQAPAGPPRPRPSARTARADNAAKPGLQDHAETRRC